MHFQKARCKYCRNSLICRYSGNHQIFTEIKCTQIELFHDSWGIVILYQEAITIIRCGIFKMNTHIVKTSFKSPDTSISTTEVVRA